MWKIFWFTVTFLAWTNAASSPPKIYLEPPYDIYYKAGEIVELPCKADGEPKPSYDWTRNDIAFSPIGNDDRIVQMPDSGTLVIYMTEDKDEGIFQCFAKNDFGRSASKKVNLRQAKLSLFPFSPVISVSPRLGQPLTLNCVPPESVPPASVFWITMIPTGGFVPLNYDSRVYMDREYRLRISNVKASDFNGGWAYACMAMNNITRANTHGPLYFITPQGVTEDLMPVKYFWSDPSDRFGLLGTNMSIICIFSGNPTPDIHWERTDNKSMSDRVNNKRFAQELQITNLQFEDAGNYECWATNFASYLPEYRTFTITVHASPYFLQMAQDVVVAIGDKAVLVCNVSGVPKPIIEWSLNGVRLEDVSDPRINGSRFHQPKDNMVTLDNVQLTDCMVFQCNASNIHGYIFANIRLDVLAEPPTIKTACQNITEAREHQNLTLTCDVTGSPLPTITWYKDGIQIQGGGYSILSNGTLVITSATLEDSGDYNCVAVNQISLIKSSNCTVIVQH